MGEWIPVEERLPENAKTVLVSVVHSNEWNNGERDYDLGFYSDGFGDWTLSTEWELGTPTVTHWMPLPEPPKVEGE